MMKFKFIFSLFMAFFLMLPAHAAKEAGWNVFVENAQVDLTPTKTEWKMVHDQEADGQYITEVIPNGQSIRSWKEIVTSTYISYQLISKENTLKAFMKTNLVEVENACQAKNASLSTKILKETATSILYRFEMKGCGKGLAADETSIVKHMKGEYGFHTMKFSSKAPLNSPEREAQMVKVISNAHLTITK